MFALGRPSNPEEDRASACDTARADACGAMAPQAPLIAHIIFRLGTGGLENGLINLINHMPPGRYRHVILCLKGYDTFGARIRVPGVQIVDLGKRDGKDIALYSRVWRILRRLQPEIVHLRNLGTIDLSWVARLAGVSHVIQGEHGWDVLDLYGTRRKYRLMRKACRPCISRYITVSSDLERWLADTIAVPRKRITHICNGVDVQRFHPRPDHPPSSAPESNVTVFGWVGRMAQVKAPLALVDAFARLLRQRPDHDLRLRMVGDGPLMPRLRAEVESAGLTDRVDLPGARDDVAEWMRTMDVFVLPSLNEGISNTILEAMASGLPVIATAVGGNPELVLPGQTGSLVAPDDPEALCDAMQTYVDDPYLGSVQGGAARRRAEQTFSLEAMVKGYLSVYDDLLQSAGPRARAAGA